MNIKKEKKQLNPIILIDGNIYIYRFYHALPKLKNSFEEPSNAIYGMVNMLLNLLKKYKPKKIIVIFDSHKKNFRHSIFRNYKNNRTSMPENLKVQISPLKSVINMLGIPTISIPTIEADDIIGTIAKKESRKGNTVLIQSYDKDMIQLVKKEIKIIYSTNSEIIDSNKIKEKYGFSPKKIVDFLCLIGDKSDSIPGISGIGKKTASILISKYGSIESIYKNLKKITPSVVRNSKKIISSLIKYKKSVFLFKKIITIKSDIYLNIEEKLKFSNPKILNLYLFFKYYNFNTWIKKIKNFNFFYQKKSIIKKKPSNFIIFSKKLKKNFHEIINTIEKSFSISFFLHFDNYKKKKKSLKGIAFSTNEKKTIYFPFKENISINDFQKIFENKKIKKISKNLKEDRKVLKENKITLKGDQYDIFVESYILNSKFGEKCNLYELKEKWIKNKIINKNEKKEKTFDNTKNNKKYTLRKNDVMIQTEIIFKLHQKLSNFFKKDKYNLFILNNIDLPLIKVIEKIENNGVLIDQHLLKEQSQKNALKLIDLKKLAHKLSNSSFNLLSNKQLQPILFKNEKSKKIKKNKNGNFSTSKTVLKALSFENPLAKIILNYRKLKKLQSNYLDTLPNMINPKDNRIHTSYHQTLTSTGRLSSKNPNLQNIPIRTKEGNLLRKSFVVPPKSIITAIDYSQIELRILAHLSNDPYLINAFKKNKDIHVLTASEIFNVPIFNVTNEQRQKAKVVNFSLIYGMTTFGLSKKINVTLKEAEKYIQVFFEKYQKVKEYIKKNQEFAFKTGFVYTVLGRKLYLPNINSKNIFLKKSAERSCINAPMQGTAADIIKKSMIEIDKYLSKKKLFSKIIMQIHDELIFEIKEKEYEKLYPKLIYIMENVITLKVPLKVSIKSGQNWGEIY
ncbi:DNA polymerase I [Buchnera aphidicola (Mindarus keteleerifoliae)]|uniref:DNA polymerase I n=1 Tax=Buchnera aphidicola TaxID=9 RepID=UPI0031B6DEAC